MLKRDLPVQILLSRPIVRRSLTISGCLKMYCTGSVILIGFLAHRDRSGRYDLKGPDGLTDLLSCLQSVYCFVCTAVKFMCCALIIHYLLFINHDTLGGKHKPLGTLAADYSHYFTYRRRTLYLTIWIGFVPCYPYPNCCYYYS